MCVCVERERMRERMRGGFASRMDREKTEKREKERETVKDA